MDSVFLNRRYLLSFESRRLPHIFTDVFVIGAGAAGLRAAIEAAAHAEVIVATKSRLADSNSYYAQGGLAAVTAGADDSAESHIQDTLATGCGLCDKEVVRHVVSQAATAIDEMRQWGVRFDLDDGELALGREGGHSANRIVHADGDATGKALTDALVERARALPNIKVWEQCFVLDLLTDPPAGGKGAQCVGALTYHPRYGLQMVRARRTIIASGGAGVLWRETSNPSVATGDGVAMCFRAGVTLADLEMMQFHPTTLYVAGATRSLVSEAVRGEGAYLLDRTGHRFMPDYHPMAELAPRDVVSRAILTQMVKTGSTHVLIDVRRLGGEFFAQRFPSIDGKCRSFGIDPGKDLIPVHPAAHYMIGGAQTDLDGRTSLAGLLACGEAAATGLHGANRLASNSLTESLVLGKRCGQAAIAAEPGVAELSAKMIDWTNPASQRTELDLEDIRNSLRSLMWRNVGVARRGDRLNETCEIVNFWGQYVLDKEFQDPSGWEVQNMLTSSYLVAQCALRRTESRGVHFREDFPHSDPLWARRSRVRHTEHQLVVE
jgi:L-aspartate oxidase